jgi:hypothetical protein
VSFRLRSAAAVLGLSLLSAAPGLLHQDPDAEVDAAGQSAQEPVEMQLTRLREHPSPHLGATLRLVVQFREQVEEWNPLLTRFGTDDFRSFSGWSDELMLWREEEWEDSFDRLFVRRRGLPDRALAVARPHERWELEVVVQDVFLGEPWLEVLTARRLPEYVSEGSILHASSALELVEEARFALARSELDRAENGPLPPHALEELAKLRAEIAQREAERAAILGNKKR